MLARTLWIAAKETRHILRDFRTLWLTLGIPLVLLLLFGYALTMDVEDIGLIVVDRDRSALSRELISAFDRSGYFTVVERPEHIRELVKRFRRGEAQAAVVIPPAFSKAAERGERATAQLIVDGADANIAGITLGYAAAIEQTLTLRIVSETLNRHGLTARAPLAPSATLRLRNWFNPTLKSQWYLVPGLVAVIMAMMSSILMSLTIAREWENGTMEQLLATPVRPLEIVAGKLLPYFVIGIGQLLLIAASGILLFKVPLRGNLGALFMLSSIFLAGGLGWGLLISIIARQQQLAMQLAILSSMLPSLLLSGFMTPIASMPPFVQLLSYLFPARYFLVILRALFLKDLPLAALWPQTVALLVYLVVVYALCFLRFRSEVA